MKRKTIGPKSALFLEALSQANKHFFDTNEASKLTKSSLAITRDFLSELVTRGLILRV
jgi:hypothetical protein